MSNDANDDKYLKSSGLCTAGLLHTGTSIVYKLQVEEPHRRDLNQPPLKFTRLTNVLHSLFKNKL